MALEFPFLAVEMHCEVEDRACWGPIDIAIGLDGKAIDASGSPVVEMGAHEGLTRGQFVPALADGLQLNKMLGRDSQQNVGPGVHMKERWTSLSCCCC